MEKENQYLIQNYIFVVTPKKRSKEESDKKRYKGRKLTTDSRFVEMETLKVRAK